MNQVVVTGATGYIGRNVVDHLGRSSVRTVALSRDPESGTFRCLLTGRRGELTTLFRDSSHLIHLAGRLIDVPAAGIMEYVPANVAFTDQVLEAAAECGIRTVVHASSRLVYPQTLLAPAVEERDAQPDTPYGLSKLWAEDLVRLASSTFAGSLSLRIGQVTGGDHPGLGVINSFVRQARERGAVTVYGRGVAVRNVVHVQDVAAAIVAALDYGGTWKAINIGGTRDITVAEMARLVAATVPGHVEVVHARADSEDTSCYALDPSLARDTLSWRPRRTPEEIIAEAAGHRR